jgi:hypothetical protein
LPVDPLEHRSQLLAVGGVERRHPRDPAADVRLEVEHRTAVLRPSPALRDTISQTVCGTTFVHRPVSTCAIDRA